MQGTRYPEITVELTGRDGNAFGIIGNVARVLRNEVSPAVSAEFTNEAMHSGSYDDLLRLVMQWVNVT
jgi:hypothetical protein